MTNTLLQVKGLKTYFKTENGLIKAVDDVNFSIERGKTLGVVGESGCGKSVTSLSVMQLVPGPKGKIVGGKILYYINGQEKAVDITNLGPHSKEMRALRGNEISMIFQEPMTSLNPVYTVGSQIIEAVRLHQSVNKLEARERAIEMLRKVGIAAPEQRVDKYPYELSGGMRQRVMIAMALSCDPSLLIADEPTTALDVTIEAQILKVMRDLQKDFGMSIMFITHDLGVIGEVADNVIVMYTGKVVEQASTVDIFYDPKHPYTQGLLSSIPKIGEKKRLIPINGTVPNLLNLPQGCYFAPRCPHAMDICRQQEPDMYDTGSNNHQAKCWLRKEGELECVK